MLHISKLAIGIASNGDMKVETACALATALSNTEVYFRIFLQKGPYIHQNRENLVKQAIEDECSHILFIDCDMVFDHLAINQILQHNLQIVGARYNARMLPLTALVPGEFSVLTEVSHIPTGFMLINLDVFKKLKKPYFFFDDKATSEDVYFCHRAKEAGFKVWCDPNIKIGHLGTMIF